VVVRHEAHVMQPFGEQISGFLDELLSHETQIVVGLSVVEAGRAVEEIIVENRRRVLVASGGVVQAVAPAVADEQQNH
jgi:hypothetical protein